MEAKRQDIGDQSRCSMNKKIIDKVVQNKAVIHNIVAREFPTSFRGLKIADRKVKYMDDFKSYLTKVVEPDLTMKVEASKKYFTRIVDDYECLANTIIAKEVYLDRLLDIAKDKTRSEVYMRLNFWASRTKPHTMYRKQSATTKIFYYNVVNILKCQTCFMQSVRMVDFSSICIGLFMELDSKRILDVFRRVHSDMMRTYRNVYEIKESEDGNDEDESDGRFVVFASAFKEQDVRSFDPRKVQQFFYKSQVYIDAQKQGEEGVSKLFKSMYLGTDNMLHISSKEVETLLAYEAAVKAKEEKKKKARALEDDEQKDDGFVNKKAKTCHESNADHAFADSDKKEKEQEAEEEEETVVCTEQDENDGIVEDDMCDFLENILGAGLASSSSSSDVNPTNDDFDFFEQKDSNPWSFLSKSAPSPSSTSAAVQPPVNVNSNALPDKAQPAVPEKTVDVALYLRALNFSQGCEHYKKEAEEQEKQSIKEYGRDKNRFHSCTSKDNVIVDKTTGKAYCRTCKLMFGQFLSHVIASFSKTRINADDEVKFLNRMERMFKLNDLLVNPSWKSALCWESLLKSRLFLNVYATYNHCMYLEERRGHFCNTSVESEYDIRMEQLYYERARRAYETSAFHTSYATLHAAVQFIVRCLDEMDLLRDDYSNQKVLLPTAPTAIDKNNANASAVKVKVDCKDYEFTLEHNMLLVCMLCPFLPSSLTSRQLYFLFEQLHVLLYLFRTGRSELVKCAVQWRSDILKDVIRKVYLTSYSAAEKQQAENMVLYVQRFILHASSRQTSSINEGKVVVERIHDMRKRVLKNMFFGSPQNSAATLTEEVSSVLWSSSPYAYASLQNPVEDLIVSPAFPHTESFVSGTYREPMQRLLCLPTYLSKQVIESRPMETEVTLILHVLKAFFFMIYERFV